MRIAFLTFNAYGILTGQKQGDVGGAQVQQVHIARELAERGHQPVFIENDRSDKEAGIYDGIEVVLKPIRTWGHPLLRAPARILDFLRLLREIDPDVCYARVLLFETLPTALYCRTTETRFVYGFAHDSELTDDPIIFETSLTDNRIYKGLLNWALESADTLVAQNEFQFDRAKEQFDTFVELIPNGYPADTISTNIFDDVDMPVVLWVSTLRPWKRPEIVIELADRIPDTMFVIVGPPAEEAPELAERIEREAAERPNVRYEGFVPYTDVDEYFADADLFLNTSEDEGFPNTFLQAWSQGTPVISLDVNPSGIVSEENVGRFTDGSIDDLATAIRSIISEDSRLGELSKTCRTYFKREHSIKTITDRYETVLERPS
jgi:glycosyltransferase involved in cell wall biosynthesis